MSKKIFSKEEMAAMTPREFRAMVRRGEWTEPDTEFCRGYAQANMAIVPKDVAFDFFLFCYRNPRPCAVIDITEVGDPCPKLVAPEADLRTDLPRYRVFRDGQLIDEPTDITSYWRNDLVAFLIGCSASFDWSLKAANVQFRLIGAYTSSIECVPAGRFKGHMVVSCRVMKDSYNAVRAVQISSRHLITHGPPIHIGDPEKIGIKDLYHPDMGGPENITPVEKDEVLMFWGCGITPQVVAMESKVPFVMSHKGWHMFVTDRLSEELAAF